MKPVEEEDEGADGVDDAPFVLGPIAAAAAEDDGSERGVAAAEAFLLRAAGICQELVVATALASLYFFEAWKEDMNCSMP